MLNAACFSCAYRAGHGDVDLTGPERVQLRKRGVHETTPLEDAELCCRVTAQLKQVGRDIGEDDGATVPDRVDRGEPQETVAAADIEDDVSRSHMAVAEHGIPDRGEELLGSTCCLPITRVTGVQ